MVILSACSSNLSTDESVKHEIELRVARRGQTLKKIEIINQISIADTLLVNYTADITVNSKDSTIQDSLFFIKSNGTILPFIKSPSK